MDAFALYRNSRLANFLERTANIVVHVPKYAWEAVSWPKKLGIYARNEDDAAFNALYISSMCEILFPLAVDISLLGGNYLHFLQRLPPELGAAGLLLPIAVPVLRMQQAKRAYRQSRK